MTGALLGLSAWALHRPWLAYLTPTRAAEAQWAAGWLIAIALGMALLGRRTATSLFAIAGVGAAVVLALTSNLPSTLGMWGLLDHTSWWGLQLARVLLAVTLAIPLAAPLGGALASMRAATIPALVGSAVGLAISVAGLPSVESAGLLASAGLAAGALALILATTAKQRVFAGCMLCVAACVVALAPPWQPLLLNGAVYPELMRRDGVRRSISEALARKPRFITEDRHGAVAVFEGQPQPSLVVAGAPHGTEPGQLEDASFSAHLAALLHPSPSRAAVLGPGVGRSIEVMRIYGIEVDAISPSPARLEALEYLGDLNGDVVPGPGVRRVTASTRRHLLTHPQGYDLILSPPGPQWTREGALGWTLQRWQSMHTALTEGGLAVVTVPLDTLSPALLKRLLSGFVQIFPNATAWLPPSGSHDLVLVGPRGQGRLPYLSILKGMSLSAAREPMSSMGLAEPTDLLSRLLAGPETLAAVVADARPLDDGAPALDDELPRAAFLPPQGHPLTAFGGHLRSELNRVDDVEQGPTRDGLEQALTRAQEAHSALIGLLRNLGEGSYDQAVEAVLQMGPRSDREVAALIAPYLERARRQLGLGLLDQAQTQLGFATTLAPRQAEPWLMMARLHARRGETQSAMDAYREALDREPQSLEALVGLADLSTEDGRLTEALGLLERARELAPQRAVIAHNIGELNRNLGDLEAARRAFESALLLDQSMAAAHAGLADVRLRLGEPGPALASAQTAVRLQANALNYEILGQVLLSLKDYNRARSALVQCLLRDPDAVGCLGGLGTVYAEDGQYDKARETWQKILDLRPEHPAALENLRRLDTLSAQRAGSGRIEIQEMVILPQPSGTQAP